MSQSEFEANTCNWHGKIRAAKTQLVLVWIPIGWESGTRFVNQLQSVVMQNQSKREITFDTPLKTAVNNIEITEKRCKWSLENKWKQIYY